MKYEVISRLKFKNPIDEETIDEFDLFSGTPSISKLNLKVFADADLNGINCPEEYINGEKEYSNYGNEEAFLYNTFWKCDTRGIWYDHSNDIEDKYPLSILNYFMNNFFDNEVEPVKGKVVLFNTVNSYILERCKVIVYNVKKSKMTYHVNESIEYTRHWVNCNKIFRGEIVNDVYPVFSTTRYDENSFLNYVKYCIPRFNLTEYTPSLVFRITYNGFLT